MKNLKDNCRSGVTGYSLPFLACLLLVVCSPDKKENSTKFTQYYNQGEKLYEKHCSNCHQKNGSGLGRIYPPVNRSDFMEENMNEVICIIRFGAQGEIVVNGVSFNQEMPGIPTLTDLEIAEIATYIYNTWEHKKGIIEVKEVSTIIQECRP